MKPIRWEETPNGGRERVLEAQRVLVVGGGLSGIAAAIVLAERGVEVEVLEGEATLGGRLAAWSDQLSDGTPFEMDRGLHAFFRQYYNLKNLIRRIDPQLECLVKLEDYPIHGPGGTLSFAGLPRAPFLNALALMRRAPGLRFRDLLRLNRRHGMALFSFDQVQTYARYDGTSARTFLDALNLPSASRQLLFDVFAHSFFNPEESMSLAEMMMQFHFYFIGNPEGLGFDLINDSYGTALWNPWQRYIEARGARITTGVRAFELQVLGGGRWRVSCSDGNTREADGIVLATHVVGLQSIIRSSPHLADGNWHSRVKGLKATLPFAVWRLWIDRRVDEARGPFISTTGYGQLDSITVFERFHHDSQRLARHTGGSVLELHAYAAPEDMTEDALKADMLAGLHRLYPETRGARVLEQRFLYHRDCPAFEVGSYAQRPETVTPWPTLMLAGDHVRLPIPAGLMERAAASGIFAANRLLQRWRVKGEPIWSVPPTGLLKVGSV